MSSRKDDKKPRKPGKRRRRAGTNRTSWWKDQWAGFKKGLAAGIDATTPEKGMGFDDREWVKGARYAEAAEIIARRAAKFFGDVMSGVDPVEALGLHKPPEPGKN